MPDRQISLIEQAAEVRNSAIGERAMLSNAGWLGRHGTAEGRSRKLRQVEVLFAAADTLDEMVRREQAS